MHSAAPARISLPLEPPHRKTRLKTCGLDVSHHRIWYAYQRTTNEFSSPQDNTSNRPQSQPVASTRRGLSLQAPEQTRNVSTTTMAMTVNSPEYAFTYVGSPGSDAAKVDPCYTR